MLHAILITLHATAAVLCFAFGAATLLAHATTRSRQSLFRYYLIMLIGMIVFLVGAILAHVNQLDGTQRAIFFGLFGLSLYMLFRGLQARIVLLSQRDDGLGSYIHHIGFTYPFLKASSSSPPSTSGLLAGSRLALRCWALSLAAERCTEFRLKRVRE